MFLNQTPHRWFPIETHSTGLPLLNYLPLPVAAAAARRWARMQDGPNGSRDLCDHLRGGLRGATEREILRMLGGKAEILEPCVPGMDRVDFWFSLLRPRWRPLKLVARAVVRGIYWVTGSVLSPNLTLAIRKPSAS